MEDIAKAARKREIEDLKKSLLAPLPGPKATAGGAPQPVVAGTLGFNKLPAATADRSDANGEGGNKFNKVMDWGTPRLVTKNRALVMDQK
jgi:hypothetical protein